MRGSWVRDFVEPGWWLGQGLILTVASAGGSAGEAAAAVVRRATRGLLREGR